MFQSLFPSLTGVQEKKAGEEKKDKKKTYYMRIIALFGLTALMRSVTP